MGCWKLVPDLVGTVAGLRIAGLSTGLVVGWLGVEVGDLRPECTLWIHHVRVGQGEFV